MSSDASKSNHVEIRPAVHADISAIVSVERKCSGASHWSEEQYEKTLLSTENRLLLVAVCDEPVPEILGFLMAHNIAPDWELENIAVGPDSRNQGIGNQLLRGLLDNAKETNSQAVFLEVRESNIAARQLYEKAGFHETGRRKSYYINPIEDAVLYAVRLPG
ncbi:MAG TPA: ribosomal protein S18-alanine N-acetyltransferase [Verrucomicrobiae bacterium]|nr:ribosomal protein S18-alanine N-acetyltransferase [Verrucomicrobiae bacterium]